MTNIEKYAPWAVELDEAEREFNLPTESEAFDAVSRRLCRPTLTALEIALGALDELSCFQDGEVGPHMDSPSDARKARKALAEISKLGGV